jgi:hypothetical protein
VETVGRVEGGGNIGSDSGLTTMPPHAQYLQNEHLECLFRRFCASEGTGGVETVRRVEGGGDGGGDGGRTTVPLHAQNQQNEHTGCSFCWFCASEGTRAAEEAGEVGRRRR